jgi:parallel beta-helix repeat protein
MQGMKQVSFVIAILFQVNAFPLQVESIPGPILDVINFGATCDGITDDSAALQAALDAIPPTGTLLITCQLAIGPAGVRLVNKSNITIKGTGQNARIRSLAPTTQTVQGFNPVLFVVRACANCVIQDLEFDGNHVRVIPLGLDHCQDTLVQSNYIHDVGVVSGGALVAAGNSRNRYRNNVIATTADDPVSATRGMWIGNTAPAENEFYPDVSFNSLVNIGATGIAIHAIGANVSGNTVDTTRGAGLKLVQPGIDPSTIIENNVLRLNHFHGLQLENVTNVTVRGNTLEGNEVSGIYCVYGISNSTITGNIIRDNDTAEQDGWQGGINIQQALNLTISNNMIYDSRGGRFRTQDNGLILNSVLAGGISNVRILNNLLHNQTHNGIQITNTGTGTVSVIEISGNTASYNSDYGLQIDEKTAGAITGIYEHDDQLIQNAKGAVRNTSSNNGNGSANK